MSNFCLSSIFNALLYTVQLYLRIVAQENNANKHK